MSAYPPVSGSRGSLLPPRLSPLHALKQPQLQPQPHRHQRDLLPPRPRSLVQDKVQNQISREVPPMGRHIVDDGYEHLLVKLKRCEPAVRAYQDRVGSRPHSVSSSTTASRSSSQSSCRSYSSKHPSADRKPHEHNQAFFFDNGFPRPRLLPRLHDEFPKDSDLPMHRRGPSGRCSATPAVLAPSPLVAPPQGERRSCNDLLMGCGQNRLQPLPPLRRVASVDAAAMRGTGSSEAPTVALPEMELPSQSSLLAVPMAAEPPHVSPEARGSRLVTSLRKATQAHQQDGDGVDLKLRQAPKMERKKKEKQSRQAVWGHTTMTIEDALEFLEPVLTAAAAHGDKDSDVYDDDFSQEAPEVEAEQCIDRVCDIVAPVAAGVET